MGLGGDFRNARLLFPTLRQARTVQYSVAQCCYTLYFIILHSRLLIKIWQSHLNVCVLTQTLTHTHTSSLSLSHSLFFFLSCTHTHILTHIHTHSHTHERTYLQAIRSAEGEVGEEGVEFLQMRWRQSVRHTGYALTLSLPSPSLCVLRLPSLCLCIFMSIHLSLFVFMHLYVSLSRLIADVDNLLRIVVIKCTSSYCDYPN